MMTVFSALAAAAPVSAPLTLVEVGFSGRGALSPLAKHEPPAGCILGAFIDLDPNLKEVYRDETRKPRKLPEEFERRVGVTHALYFFYLGYGQKAPVDWISRLHQRDKFVHIAFEPNRGLEEVKDDAYLRQFADDLARSDASIFLRFASEMNGSWTNYGGKPALFREKFRLVARVMAERAPNVAMVWCPAAVPAENIDAYYPGADVVDWAGLNFYSVTFFNQDLTAPASDVLPQSLLRPFYSKYSARHPIMIGEYGATSFSMVEGRERADFAAERISGLYASLPTQFPRVKAVNYFSCDATQLAHRRNNDYTLTTRSEVTIAYRKAVSGSHFLTSRTEARALDEGGRVVSPSARIRSGSVIRIDEYLPSSATCIFLIDGRVQTTWRSGERWHAEISAPPGARTLTVEVVDAQGRTLGQRSIELTVL